MITRRTVLSTVALGASGLVAGAGLLGIAPDVEAANADNRNTQEHRRTKRRNRKQRRRQRQG
jgi:hypothetical protein